MNEGNKTIVLIFLGVVTIWDAYTTVSGTLGILGATTGPIILSILCAVFVGGILINTVPVISNPSDDVLTTGSKGLWGLCLVYDFYTAYVGNSDLTSAGGEGRGIFILILMTAITVACPITISYILFKRN
jgi:hypothetical protein